MNSVQLPPRGELSGRATNFVKEQLPATHKRLIIDYFAELGTP